MCDSHSKNAADSHAGAASANATALTFKVDDMTCGHCAGTIKKAIESSIPGASVHADPASKIVSVTGATDRDALAGIITSAGYTPVRASA